MLLRCVDEGLDIDDGFDVVDRGDEGGEDGWGQ